MPAGDKPNILVIWGDDIGISNLSCYSGGLMGYRTPNIDRIADEGIRFTDSYGEQSCTAGRSSFITGQSVFRTGLSKVGIPGSPIGLQAEDVDDRRAAEADRLLDRAVRQEPPRRPQRVPADGARLRRVLRQPLPPERRGGARARELSAGRRVPPVPRAVRAARRDPLVVDAGRRRHRPRAASAASGKPADRGHRAAHEEADGDHRRRGRRRRARLHRPPARGRDAVLRVGQHHPHARLHAHEGREPRARPGAGSRRTTTR